MSLLLNVFAWRWACFADFTLARGPIRLITSPLSPGIVAKSYLASGPFLLPHGQPVVWFFTASASGKSTCSARSSRLSAIGIPIGNASFPPRPIQAWRKRSKKFASELTVIYWPFDFSAGR